MSKKSGLLPLITGMIAGAAAMFFSDQKNRDLANKQIDKATAVAKILKKKFDEDPDRTIDEVVETIKTKASVKAKKMQGKLKKIAKVALADQSTTRKQSKRS